MSRTWARLHGWRRALAVAVALIALAGVGARAGSAKTAGGPTCLVVGVEDAATLRLHCGAAVQTLRLASLRAPRPGTVLEGGQPFGTRGLELARGWFLDRRVQVGNGTVRLGGEDVRLGLLALGLVEWAGGDAAADAPLRAAEREARLASRGLWSYDAWRRHQATRREPLLVPGLPPLPGEESIGAVAARYQRKSAAERRAAFDAAVSQLAALPKRSAEPAAESRPDRPRRGPARPRRARAPQPR